MLDRGFHVYPHAGTVVVDLLPKRTCASPGALVCGLCMSVRCLVDCARHESRCEIELFYVRYEHRLVFRHLARRLRVAYRCDDPRGGVPERVASAYASPRPWPAYMRGAEWSAEPCTMPEGTPCGGALAPCSSRGMCLLSHVVRLRVNPRSLAVHARLARFHATPGVPLPWGTVDPWRFAVIRVLAHDRYECASRMEQSWQHVLQRMPEGDDPLLFAAHKANAVLVVLYNDWWLGMAQMQKVPQSAFLHSVCMRSARRVVGLLSKCMRQARRGGRWTVARACARVAALVVQTLCVLPDAPCRPWMLALFKFLSASCTLVWSGRHVPCSGVARPGTGGTPCMGPSVGVLAVGGRAESALRVARGADGVARGPQLDGRTHRPRV